MQRRNWLQLARKLVDRTDLDYTVNAIQNFLSEQALSYFGEGVLKTTLYPNPFPVTLSGSVFGGSVGTGLGYDPTGQLTEITLASTSDKTFTIPAADSSRARLDLLVIRYNMKGDTLVPKPSDPITSVYLNLLDDFVLAIIPGVPSATPAYPAKGSLDIILAGIQVPAAATLGNQCTVDLSVREIATQDAVKTPVLIQEIPAGVVDGINSNYNLSYPPMNGQSVLLFLDGYLVPKNMWALSSQTITFATSPKPGQDVYVWYFEASPSSINPLSGAQETPTGAVDGTNDTFSLMGKPADQRSTMLFVDGLIYPTAFWDLVQGFVVDSIKFKPGKQPKPGQDIYVFYLVNPASVGTAPPPVTPGGGGGAYTVTGTINSPEIIDPASGIPVSTNQRQLDFVASQGGQQNVTANPQIQPGTIIGMEKTLIGTSNSNYPSLADGSGLSLNGAMDLKKDSAIYLFWNGSVWAEISRR
jgi:hypothetical protein